MRRRFAGWLLAAFASGAAPAWAAPTADLAVARDGSRFTVRAVGTVPADLHLAWATIVDYDAMARFVPGLQRARVLAREDERRTVEFVGNADGFLLDRVVRMRLAIDHAPPYRVDSRLLPDWVDGAPPSLAAYRGYYVLTAVPIDGRPGVRLEYGAELEVGAGESPLLLALLGSWSLHSSVRGQFEALLAEIERRQKAASGK
ncbi:MAG: SRPBCC family protein [Betaproteobacteria bacterium]